MLELQKLHRGPGLGPPPLLRDVYGAVLRRERRRQRRTLDDVASRAGVSLQYLSEIERGRKEASSEILAAVCASLGSGLAAFLAAVHRELAAVEGRPVLHLQSTPSAVRPPGPARKELTGGETPPADAGSSGPSASPPAMPPLAQGVDSGKPACKGLQNAGSAGLRSVGPADRGLQYADPADLLSEVLADRDLAPQGPADAGLQSETGAQGGPPAILMAA